MLLVIDLGNTTLTLGVFDQSELKHHWRLTTDRNRTEDEYGLQMLGLLENCDMNSSSINAIVLSSVVPPLTEWVVRACQDYLKIDPLIVNADLDMNIKVL